MQITKDEASLVPEVVDYGLSSGLGYPIPGRMCIEAAVCYALGEPHGDQPTCVSPALRRFVIGLSDGWWSSNNKRAQCLRRIALAQLATNTVLYEIAFAKELSGAISRLLNESTFAKSLSGEIACWADDAKADDIAANVSVCWAARWADDAAADQFLIDVAELVVQILLKNEHAWVRISVHYGVG